MHHKSVAEMCEEYRGLYAEYTCTGNRKEPVSDSAAEPADFDFIFQGLALANPSVNGKGGAASMNRLRNENAALKASIEVLKGTTSYRIARKIADAKIPFKEQLKKALKRR